jgi:hypothetical protein
MALDCLSGGCEAPGTGYLPWCSPCRSLVDQISYGEVRLYQGELIRCQSDHGDYACSRGGVAMSDGDETNSSIRVSVVSYVWAPVITSCHVWH